MMYVGDIRFTKYFMNFKGVVYFSRICFLDFDAVTISMPPQFNYRVDQNLKCVKHTDKNLALCFMKNCCVYNKVVLKKPSLKYMINLYDIR
jgi:hypothetical protein